METRAIKTKLDGDGDDDDDDDVDLLHLEVILPFVVKSRLQTAEIWSDWHQNATKVPPASLQKPGTSECKWSAD